MHNFLNIFSPFCKCYFNIHLKTNLYLIKNYVKSFIRFTIYSLSKNFSISYIPTSSFQNFDFFKLVKEERGAKSED